MSKKTYRVEYDLIRVLAMLCVVWFHFHVGLMEFGIQSPVMLRNAGENLTFGQQGVVLFFILSGATSCMSYERCLRNNKERGIRGAVVSYYNKRLWALLPLFWIAYFVAYILIYLPHGGRMEYSPVYTLLGLDGYLMMRGIKTNYQVGEWFMGAILLLYLAFPMLYHLIRKWPKRTMLLLVLGYILITECFPFDWPKETWALLRMFDLAVGICFGLYIHTISWKAAAAAAAVCVVTVFVKLPGDNMYAVLLQGISLFVVLHWIGQWIGEQCGRGWDALRIGLKKISGYAYAVFLIHHIIMNRALLPFSGQGWGYRIYVDKFLYVMILIAVSSVLLQGAGTQVTESARTWICGIRNRKCKKT